MHFFRYNICAILFLLVPWCGARDYSFNEYRFRQQVDKALESVRTILDTTRHPVLLEDASDHTYNDKYTMVETMTNTAIAASISILERLGIGPDYYETILNWIHDQKRPVVLRFHMQQQCSFDKKTERKVVTAEQEIERSSQGTGGSGIIRSSVPTTTVETETVKIKQTIHEYHWKIQAPYSLTLVSGTDEIEVYRRGTKGAGGGGEEEFTSSVVLSGGSSSQPPAPLKNATSTFDLNLTWLLQMLALENGNNINNNNKGDDKKKLATKFEIHRGLETCRTPSRNIDIEKIRNFQKELNVWTYNVMSAFDGIENGIFYKDYTHRRFRMSDTSPFNPILPISEENSTMLSEDDIKAFVSRYESDIDSIITQISNRVSSSEGGAAGAGALSGQEATIGFLVGHLSQVMTDWKQGVDYMEKMLENQLYDAIGKEITVSDFDQFMSFHTKKMFDKEYSPKPFSYAVRRENFYPDGIISIEKYNNGFNGGNNNNNNQNEPIETMSRHIAGGEDVPSLYIPVDAATTVEIRGDRYLHGWIQYQFGQENNKLRTHQQNNNNNQQYHFVARANQFSSFLVILGVMGGSDTFIPKNAIIIQNKDKILIDLLTDVLPSAKEFQDAISSLSDEQKAFAQAFRSMQLESSVFGICIIQIKPQLEKLLNLPAGSLTKEIQLTQDLMSLFVEYQIPSDLLSFDGSDDDTSTTVTEKVTTVKNNVKAVMDVIANEKKKQIEEEKQKREMREKMYSPLKQSSDSPYATPSGVQPVSGPSGTAAASSRSSSRQEIMMMTMTAQMDEASSLPSSSPSSTSSQQQQKQGHDTSSTNNKSQESQTGSTPSDNTSSSSSAEDFTLIPKILDAVLEKNDKEGSLKSTTIKAGTDYWTRTRQANLLVSAKTSHLYTSELEQEKHQAMDLLTALSRSGSLPIIDAASELHVIVALTHCFQRDIISTIIEDNVNPIEKVEKSLLLLGSTIQNQPPSKLLSAAAAAERHPEALEGRV